MARTPPDCKLQGAWKAIGQTDALYVNPRLTDARLLDAADGWQTILVEKQRLVLVAALPEGWFIYLHQRRKAFKKMLKASSAGPIASKAFHRLCELLSDAAVALGGTQVHWTLFGYRSEGMLLRSAERTARRFDALAPEAFAHWHARQGTFPDLGALDCRLDLADRTATPVLQVGKSTARFISLDDWKAMKPQGVLQLPWNEDDDYIQER